MCVVACDVAFRAPPDAPRAAQLTDFGGVSKPSLPMCSLSDMVGLDPADLVTKLKCVLLRIAAGLA